MSAILDLEEIERYAEAIGARLTQLRERIQEQIRPPAGASIASDVMWIEHLVREMRGKVRKQ